MSACHINSKSTYLIISIAAAVLIHAAAVFVFLFSKPGTRQMVKKENIIYGVSIVSIKQKQQKRLLKKSTQKHVALEKAIKKHKQYKPAVKNRHQKKSSQHTKTAYKMQNNQKNYSQKTVSAAKIVPIHPKTLNINRTITVSESSYTGIFSWVASHKFYPTKAVYKEEEGFVYAAFTIEKNGAIKNIQITKQSFASLNAAVVRILQHSSPIPKTILKSTNLKLPVEANLKIEFRLKD